MPDFRPLSFARRPVTPITVSAGLAKYSGPELRKILGDAGVTCVEFSLHHQRTRENLAARIAWAKDVGLTQMLVPTLGGPAKPTMDDVKHAADEYNKMGEQAAKAGIQQGLHNEDFELSTVDGKRTYDLLFDLLIPSWSSSSSRSPPSAAATTPQSTSRNILVASFPCTYKAGPRKPRKSCRWVRAHWIGRRSLRRRKPAASKTTSLK